MRSKKVTAEKQDSAEGKKQWIVSQEMKFIEKPKEEGLSQRQTKAGSRPSSEDRVTQLSSSVITDRFQVTLTP